MDMALSVKAQEVRDYIVEIGGSRHWIERAKFHLAPKGQHESGPAFERDAYALLEELKAAFANKFSAADDHDWEELADWLFSSAQH